MSPQAIIFQDNVLLPVWSLCMAPGGQNGTELTPVTLTMQQAGALLGDWLAGDGWTILKFQAPEKNSEDTHTCGVAMFLEHWVRPSERKVTTDCHS